MVLYEVTARVELPAAGEYATWLVEHVRQMLEIRGFTSARIWERTDLPEAEQARHREFVAQYELESQAALDSYFREHSARMRGDANARFGGKFVVTRRVFGEVRA